MKVTWTERLALGTLRFIPRPVADAPERMLINGSCILIGLAALFTPRSGRSVMAHWPSWFQAEWSLGMICGGLLTLIGLSAGRWALERWGLLLVAVCSLVYASALITLFWPRGVFSALIFLGIAAAKATRFVVSSATRARLIHRPPPPGEGDRPGDS